MSRDNLPVDESEDDDGPLWWRKVRENLNFYRIHIMYYVSTPLIFSWIFYGSNGRYPFAYIDSLYTCVSAMVVCGLTPINMSALTGFQQALLFVQMCIGNPVIVSWFTVLLRRHYFATKFKHVLRANAKRQAAEIRAPKDRSSRWPDRISTLLGRRQTDRADHTASHDRWDGDKKGINQGLRPDMIRRMDDELKRVNPSGMAVPSEKPSSMDGAQTGHLSFAPPPFGHNQARTKSRRGSLGSEGANHRRHFRRLSDPGAPSRPSSPVNDTMQAQHEPAAASSPGLPQTFTRTPTIDFAPDVRRRAKSARGIAEDEIAENEQGEPDSDHRSAHSRRGSLSRHPYLSVGYGSQTHEPNRSKHRGFGGFPMPFDLITRLFGRIFPRLRRRLSRTLTIPATTSLVSQQREAPPGAKSVPYLSFDAMVGRNSAFRHLTHAEMEELGGVEYRALNALLWIIGVYHVAIQLVIFVVIAPYISRPRWRSDFGPPNDVRPQNPVWFSAFQAVSAYTNTGLSLEDKSMQPFQRAYPMIFLMIFGILAGNTAFPVFLRFTIWVLSKTVSGRSRAHETLHFLLDHPRRCFIFLFPSHQTWFLLTVVVLLTAIDWFFFMILDIGNPATESIPLGVRFVVGFFQAIAVRAAGFTAVSLSSLAAGVQVLFVIMMYISVYPIAMSVRSTNVYEEQSLGIFPHDDDHGEEEFQPTGPRAKIWGRYLAMHARRQLAFDMWWLGVALFVICINERHNLGDPSKASWFNIFTLIFELVSAYGTVGLSLGTPNNNFSFSGELKPLSKFVIILVMLRGRHRILPVAIDRAVMLPSELQRQLDQDVHTRSQAHTSFSGHRTLEDETHQVRFGRTHNPSQAGDDRSAHQARENGAIPP
ncbi:putative cation transport protein [Lyophyllum shimeji]|uniref:Potassium transport protein n=1 Tax=Lyophyllum shimeji TaxID=47721 RepID=A0A9P3PL64_LYOSH|nr:putative cation transport protein [Lyophyllum shimeji]